jgi:hypothetical protein
MAAASFAIFTSTETCYNLLHRSGDLGQRSTKKFEKSIKNQQSDTYITDAEGLVHEGQSVR